MYRTTNLQQTNVESSGSEVKALHSTTQNGRQLRRTDYLRFCETHQRGETEQLTGSRSPKCLECVTASFILMLNSPLFTTDPPNRCGRRESGANSPTTHMGPRGRSTPRSGC